MYTSVVVPTYLRPDFLDRCLQALVAQQFDSRSFEIIVADDAGSHAMQRQVEAWASRSEIPIHYVSPTSACGPAAARNAGWHIARGEIIAFTDDDCIPDRHWLAEGTAAFASGAAAVSGRVIVPLPARPTDYERDAAGLEHGEFVTANCFVRRAVLEAVGGFDERFAAAWREDSDLHFTLLERRQRVDRVAGAIVVHPVRPAPWGICLRQQRKSLFNALLFKKYPQLYRLRIRASPPWDYYAIVASLATALVGALAGPRGLTWAALVVWLLLTTRFCARRLARNSLSCGHVTEMLVTSALVPPVSIFWRLYGAFKFRVFFL